MFFFFQLRMRKSAAAHNANSTTSFGIITLGSYTGNYPIIILNVDISFLVNKVMQYFDMATFSCQVQGSHLMEKKKALK